MIQHSEQPRELQRGGVGECLCERISTGEVRADSYLGKLFGVGSKDGPVYAEQHIPGLHNTYGHQTQPSLRWDAKTHTFNTAFPSGK